MKREALYSDGSSRVRRLLSRTGRSAVGRVRPVQPVVKALQLPLAGSRCRPARRVVASVRRTRSAIRWPTTQTMPSRSQTSGVAARSAPRDPTAAEEVVERLLAAAHPQRVEPIAGYRGADQEGRIDAVEVDRFVTVGVTVGRQYRPDRRATGLIRGSPGARPRGASERPSLLSGGRRRRTNGGGRSRPRPRRRRRTARDGSGGQGPASRRHRAPPMPASGQPARRQARRRTSARRNPGSRRARRGRATTSSPARRSVRGLLQLRDPPSVGRDRRGGQAAEPHQGLGDPRVVLGGELGSRSWRMPARCATVSALLASSR